MIGEFVVCLDPRVCVCVLIRFVGLLIFRDDQPYYAISAAGEGDVNSNNISREKESVELLRRSYLRRDYANEIQNEIAPVMGTNTHLSREIGFPANISDKGNRSTRAPSPLKMPSSMSNSRSVETDLYAASQMLAAHGYGALAEKVKSATFGICHGLRKNRYISYSLQDDKLSTQASSPSAAVTGNYNELKRICSPDADGGAMAFVEVDNIETEFIRGPSPPFTLKLIDGSEAAPSKSPRISLE